MHDRQPNGIGGKAATRQDELLTVEEPLTTAATIIAIFPAGFVWAVTPACWLFALYHILTTHTLLPSPASHPFYKTLLYHAYLEIPFSLWYQHLCRKAQAHPVFAPKPEAQMKDLLMQCLDVGLDRDHGGMDRRPRAARDHFEGTPEDRALLLRTKLRTWFYNVPFSSIYADNAREWLFWSIGGGRTMQEGRSDPASSKLVEECLVWVEQRCGVKFPPGYNPTTRCLRLTLDPVKVLSRPLGYYVVCNGATFLCYAWLVGFKGFRMRSSHGCQFLVKPPLASPPTHAESQWEKQNPNPSGRDFRLPVVFLHGLGIGLAQYFAFLRYLAESEKGVIILLQPNISTQIWHPRFLSPPSKAEHVEGIKEVAKGMGIGKATICSHSNGTMVHAWLLRGAPELCARNVVVDPVCFRLWEADVCYTFLYQRWRTGIQILLGYFVARELGVAHTIGRDFEWSDMIMWEHEIPSVTPSTFHAIIGERDFLLDSASVAHYLYECGVPKECVTVCKGYQHGHALVVDSFGMQKALECL